MRLNIKACAAGLLLACAPLPAAAAAPRRPSVVLVILDAVRADRTSPYGYAAAATPELARFAAGAAVYENAYANSNWTAPSFATMLTGRRLFAHGLAGFLDSPAEDLPTLPGLLAASGYETAAFFSGLPGEPAYGFARGFGSFEVLPATCPFGSQVSAAQAWLERLPPEKDFFIAVHGLDVHNPRNCAGGPAEPGPDLPLIGAAFLNYYNDLPGRDLDRVDAEQWRQVLSYKRDPEFLARLSRDYDRCVSQLDAGLGRLLRLLERQAERPLLVIITADHGQLLGEHGRLGHVTTFYEQLVRVPLVIGFPGGSGRRVKAPAEHVDLLPTVCAAAGVPCPAVDGRDLARAEEAAPRTSWAAGSASGPPGAGRQIRSAAYREGKQKLARHQHKWELFDLAADPGESENLAAARPADFLRLASGYLELSGAGAVARSSPAPYGAPGNCLGGFDEPFSPPAGKSACEQAIAKGSWYLRRKEPDAAAKELAGPACSRAEAARPLAALELMRQALLDRGEPQCAGCAFSTAPGRWQMAAGDFSVTYEGAGGLACALDGAPSQAAGCVPPAAALLDCVEKYRFPPATPAGQSTDLLQNALKKAGYLP